MKSSLATVRVVLASCWLFLITLTGVAHAATTNMPGPSGSEAFGARVVVLPNGNFVVSDPGFDKSGPSVQDAGAVFFYSPTGVLISTLTGSDTEDFVGSDIIVLPNGNFLVVSYDWSAGGYHFGAVTWVNGTTGLNGVVSAANSLIGTEEDHIYYSDITVLTNSNFVIVASEWDNGAVEDAGAVTFGNGTTGTVGDIDASNSLVGTADEDLVGSGGVTALTNGSYVVSSPDWDDGGTENVGAVTWCNGSTGRVGTVSAANSLVGVTGEDKVGDSSDHPGVVALTNGNFVVVVPGWDDGAIVDAGAVTWGNGATGAPVGPVTTGNSLHGSVDSDSIGNQGVVALTNDNYVVASPLWDDGATADVGAVTWGNGATGITGAVGLGNAVVGATASDIVGSYGVTPLTNGHFVICSPSWDAVGAATWCDGATGFPAGATGFEAVSALNSLRGLTSGDGVGERVIPLSNGHYVVASSAWNMGTRTEAGAVTWGNGVTGTTGPVDPGNSLVGGYSGEFLGADQIEPLTNGNYVVGSPFWDSPLAVGAGAATWCSGTGPTVGEVSAANSLIGSSANDTVGYDITALTNGNYVVSTPVWSNGEVQSVGAVTWCKGDAPTAAAVSPTNSLIGAAFQDAIGLGEVVPQPDGNYVVLSPYFNNGPSAPQAGAVTLGNGATGTIGTVSSAISVLGTIPGGGTSTSFDYEVARAQMFVGLPFQNRVVRTGGIVVNFTMPLYTALEEVNTMNVVITRTGTLPIDVTFATSATGATAMAGTDYAAIAARTESLGANIATKTIPITIVNDLTANEPNETFKVVLSSPSAGVELGALATATVRIVDNDTVDATLPGAPVISTPAANALLPVNPGASVLITGTATDNRGITGVEARLNGVGLYLPATLTANSGTTANYSIALPPVGGTNTIQVRSIDTRGNTSPAATRTFRVSRLLRIVATGTATFTTGFSPSSFREVGKSYTVEVTPGAGQLFSDWDLAGPSSALNQSGVTPSMLEKRKLTFNFYEGLSLTANLAANPYVVFGVAGEYNGSIVPDPMAPDRAPAGAGQEDGTLPSNSTQGVFSGTLMTTGAFSGKLTIDGLVLGVAGDFDANGNARFGSSRALTVAVPRPNKPSLTVVLTHSGTTITGIVTAQGFQKSVVTAVSNIVAERAYFNGLAGGNIVPDEYLAVTGALQSPAGRTDGVFTVILPSIEEGSQPQRIINAGYVQQLDYPAGTGVGTVKVTKAGGVTLTGTLADGTPVSASGKLQQNLQAVLYAQLYNKLGFLSVPIQLDTLNPLSDIWPAPGLDILWCRPVMTTSHYYPHGWAEGLKVDLLGAKYVATAGQSILKAADGIDGDNIGEPLQAPDADGNATLIFNAGQLTADLTKAANLSATDAVTKVPGNDTTFTLSIDRATGGFSGTFDHTSDTKPTYQGIIYQKGPIAGGYGFFQTKQPSPIDYTGESGGVRLMGQ